MNSVVSHPKPPLSPAELSPLIQLKRLRTIGGITRVYFLLAVVITLCIITKSIWLIIPSLFVIGALQHAISILQHEAVHGLISSNRRVNDWVGNALLSYPIGFSLEYRTIHFTHHRSLGGEQDPDMQNYAQFPASRRAFFKKIIQDFSGFGAIRQFLTQKNPDSGKKHLLGIIGAQLILLSLFALAHAPLYYVVLWLFPLVTIAKGFAQLQNIAEHLVRNPAEAGSERIRTFTSSHLERFFLAPCNFNYHAEHHWYPMVPYYHLPALRTLLNKNPSFAQNAEIASSYVSVLRRTITPNI